MVGQPRLPQHCGFVGFPFRVPTASGMRRRRDRRGSSTPSLRRRRPPLRSVRIDSTHAPAGQGQTPSTWPGRSLEREDEKRLAAARRTTPPAGFPPLAHHGHEKPAPATGPTAVASVPTTSMTESTGRRDSSLCDATFRAQCLHRCVRPAPTPGSRARSVSTAIPGPTRTKDLDDEDRGPPTITTTCCPPTGGAGARNRVGEVAPASVSGPAPAGQRPSGNSERAGRRENVLREPPSCRSPGRPGLGAGGLRAEAPRSTARRRRHSATAGLPVDRVGSRHVQMSIQTEVRDRE